MPSFPVRLASLAATSLLAAAPALASGPGAVTPMPEVIAAPAASDWGGIYVGAYGGLARGEGYDLGGPGFPYPFADSSTFGGLFAGYRHQIGAIVLGGEVATTLANGIVQECCTSWEFDRLTDLRLSVGRDMGRALVSVSAGYSWSDFLPGGAPALSYNGWLVGLGVDYQVTERFFVGADYIYRDLESPRRSGWGADIGALQLRGGWRF